MSKKHSDAVREAVAVFNSSADLEAAIDDLLTHGFNRAHVSLMAGKNAVEEKLRHAYRSTRELEDDPEVPTIAYVSRESVGDAEGGLIGGLMYIGALAGMVPVFATGGPVAAALVAATLAGGAGAAAGGALAHAVGRRHAAYLEKQLEAGGVLLWVRTMDEEHERRAVDVLKKHSGEDVHVHEFWRGHASLVGQAATSPDFAKALLDPDTVFGAPGDVTASTSLSREQKVEVLRRWARECRTIDRAKGEGMPGPDPSRLQEVERELIGLGAEVGFA